MNTKSEKVKTYKAKNDLQEKIGSGPLDMAAIEQAQKKIENNDIDFSPMGMEFLNQLDSALNDIKRNPDKSKIEEHKKMLIGPVMELKANAAIFHYALVGNLANIMLNFLESISELDKDALSIVSSHHDSLKAILNGKMKGDGGENGQTMVSELKDACTRYYKKKRK